MIIETLKEKFKKITETPEKLKELVELFGNYNIETSTMGGSVFWNTLIESNGYKLQQNKITSLCRILDHNNHRKAWGTVSNLEIVINKIIPNIDLSDLMFKTEELLIKLADFKTKGLITEEEYADKKKEILSKI